MGSEARDTVSNISSFYSFDKVFSYNGTFNFIVGDRGVGKTYGAKRKAIRDALKNNTEFIYLRRFKEDIQSRQTFFADIMHEFPEWDFRVNGMVGECAPSATRKDKKRPWRVICYFKVLSQAAAVKSQPFPLVTLIIFDEFILERGMRRYLPDEYHAFLEFFNTVDRMKDKTRVLFLANAISIMNPYFIELEIRPDESGEFVTRSYGSATNFVVCHFINASKFRDEAYQSKFGQFIKDTDYAKYSIESEFSDDNDNLLQLKNKQAKYYYSLETRYGTFSVWYDQWRGLYYIQARRPKQEISYTLLPENMSEEKTLLLYNSKLIQFLRTAFQNGMVFFDKPSTRNSFIDIFRR